MWWIVYNKKSDKKNLTEYKRKNLVEKAYQILSDNKIQIKNITEGKIINMISEWKNNSQRFKWYLFFEDNKLLMVLNFCKCIYIKK